MALHKKGQTQRKENNSIPNKQQRVCELVISNFLMMSASTLEVPVQKNQLTIAAAQFVKARDTLNAHIKISIKEKSIVLEKDNAQTTVESKNGKHSRSTKIFSKEKKTVAKPKIIKEKSKKEATIQLSEALLQSQCEEIITKFLATKSTEPRTAIIQQFATAGIPIANTNTQTQTNKNCTVQSIEIHFSEDSKRSAVLALIRARDNMKAQIKVRFSKQGVILIKVENSTKTVKEN
jgi:hypothetical protein